MPNRLAEQTSPYLRQHAENPVDWYPWGDEAFEHARAEDKPVFLSVGYSACHWCHVMERESFEDDQTAALLNRHFIAVKVDREERPDVDAVYMEAVQALTARGGWPMSVFLTPDAVPFFGGTYFPDTPRFGMPSFRQVLEHVSDLWRNRRDDVVGIGDELAEALQQQAKLRGEHGVLHGRRVLDDAISELFGGFDELHGGWLPAPKFPQPPLLEFLLARYTDTREERVLHLAKRTLDGMLRGGIYDQLGGGFHRYSTDDKWLVPHFEKMLYDNAQLALVYTHAWQLTREPAYRRVAEQTLEYLLREMADPAGGFYSAQDADTDGEEGRYFVWTPDDIRRTIAAHSAQPERDAHLFMAAYGVTDQGNFEGRTVLALKHTAAELARIERTEESDVEARLSTVRGWLLHERERRTRPGLDDKVLASWNGLALAAFAAAARVFGREDFRHAAERNAAFLLSDLRREDGRMLHTWHSGQAQPNGFLEDHALVAAGLLELHQTTFEEGWFVAARELCDIIVEHFADPDGGFHDTSDDHEALFMRPRNLFDHVMPSAGSMAAEVLLKVASYAGNERYAEVAEAALAQAGTLLSAAPHSMAHWLQVLGLVLAPPVEIAIVGPDLERFAAVVNAEFRPHAVVTGAPGVARQSHIELLADRDPGPANTCAYVCRGGTCERPACSAEALEEVLGPTTVAVGVG